MTLLFRETQVRLCKGIFSLVFAAAVGSLSQLAGASQNPDGSPVGAGVAGTDGTGGALQYLFAPRLSELHKLIQEKQLGAADLLVGREGKYFRETEAAHPLISKLVDGLNSEYEPKFREIEEKLKGVQSSDYERLQGALVEAESLIEEYSRLNVFIYSPHRPISAHGSLKQLSESITAQLHRGAIAAFLAFDHAGAKGFFEAYPVKLDRDAFVREALPELLKWVNELSAVQIKMIHERQSELLRSNETLRRAAANRFVEANLGSQTGPVQLSHVLSVVEDARKSGVKLDEIPGARIAFAEVTSQTLLNEGQIEYPVSVNVDMPFESVKTSVDGILELASKDVADFVIVVDVAQARTSRRITGKRDVAARYVSGTRTEHNPAYDFARSRVVEAQAGLINARLSANQSVGLAAAILNGVAVGAWQSRLNEAQSLLASTPSQLTKDVFSDYKYSVSEVDATKSTTINYFVIDRRRSLYRKSTVDFSEARKFKISYNLNERDPERGSVLSSHDSEDDLANFEKTPVVLTASALIQDYLSNPTQLQPLDSIQTLREEMLKDKNSAIANYKSRQFDAKPVNDQRFDSVVVVYNPAGSQGAGFYVTPDLVLTNFHVVEGAKFVEMKLYNGLETFGKVVKSDVRLDLALVKVEARGNPVSLYKGQTIELGSTVEAIGHPRGLSFTLTRGVVSALRKRPSIYGVGGKDVLFVQTDAAINPGNSGGPLYLGQEVVGVNNNKMVRGAEGLGFAVHYSELDEFMAEALK